MPMRVIAGTPPAIPFRQRLLIAAVFGSLMLAALSPVPMIYVAPAAAGAMLVAAFHRTILSWRVLITSLVLVILFIPMRRYTLPFSAGGFELEPYRVLVAFIVGGWALSLLIDRRVKLRRTGLEAPLGLIALSMLWSIAWNADEIVLFGIGGDVLKATIFFAFFPLIFYVLVSTLRVADVHRLVKVLVLGGAVVGVLTVFEGQTGTNLFDKLGSLIPFLHEHVDPKAIGADDASFNRGDRARTYASAEHPIALAAALGMLLPIGVALAITRSNRWWLAVLPMGMATLATLSRTGVLMLIVIGIVFLWLRPGKTLRMWWAIIPLLVACNVVMPHTLGILKTSFFPEGGLINEQRSSEGSTTAGGRATDFAPVLARVHERPIFGVGFATTVMPVQGQVDQPLGVATPPPTRILDNQWLGTLLETGYVGAFAWLWLFLRFVRRIGRAARQDRDDTGDGWLLVGITAAIASHAVGMFTYDAFAFTQATFIMFILMALGAILGREALVGRRAAARQSLQRSSASTGRSAG
jgi:polysaccharide biosynthesis protein PslJ